MRPVATRLRAIDFHLGRFFRGLSAVWLASLAALAILALILGDLGCHQIAIGRPRPASELDLFYDALRLFVMELPDTDRRIPLTLEVARYLAAFVSFSAAIGLLGKVFDNQLQQARIWFLGRNHVVICGLGDVGGDLVESLRRRFTFVVVIEPDPAHIDLPRCRDRGAVILIGSSADASRLRKARIDRAQVASAILGNDDRLNVETGVLAYEICRDGRSTPLTFLLQISDPELFDVVRKHPMTDDPGDRFHLQFFDARETCARAMLRRALVLRDGVGPRHLLVVGLGQPDQLGETLVLRAAKNWHIEHGAKAPKLRIDVVDPEATRRVADLQTRCPFVAQICDLHPLDDLADSHAVARQEPPEAVFVCLGDETMALVAADRYRTLFPREIPVIVRTIEEDVGLGSLIRGRSGDHLVAVGINNRVFQLAATLQPAQELVAESVHHEYYKHLIQSAGPLGPERTAVRLWEDLAEDYRIASRAQAADIPRKLSLIGLQAIGAPNAPITPHEFTAEEVEQLAIDEHERWCNERRQQGWTLGDPRDNRKKHHPNLVPWNDKRLTEPLKEIDRNAIRRLPAALAQADYQIIEARPQVESKG